MSKFRISRNGLVCGTVVFLQLLWMQTKVFFPGLGGMAYQLLYYMKYIGTFAVFALALSTPRERKITTRQREYIKLFIPLFMIVRAYHANKLVKLSFPKIYFIRMLLVGILVSYGYFKKNTPLNIGILAIVSIWSFIENRNVIMGFVTAIVKKVRKE